MPFRRLPPLLSLRAFEAAARHGSFKAAAEELNVTPGAVSQQVKKLEEDLGVTLFVRHNRVIEPTSEGLILKAGLSDAFVRIREVVESVRPSNEERALVVTCGPPFAAKWLVPRLNKFLNRHPEIDLQVAANFTKLEYGTEGTDVGIRFTKREPDDLHFEWLGEETVVPLASPSFIERQNLREPRDLMRVPLLTEESMRIHEGAPGWEDWFAAVGLTEGSTFRGVNFGRHAEQAIDAAIAGAGVVLGRRILAALDIAEGRLVAPFGPELRTGVRYQFVCRKDRQHLSRTVAFHDWVVEEIEFCNAVETQRNDQETA